jgi:hypothetical protein
MLRRNLAERCIEFPVAVFGIFGIIDENSLSVDPVGSLGHTKGSIDPVDWLFSESLSIQHDEIEKYRITRFAMLFLYHVQFPQGIVPDEKVLLFVAQIRRVLFTKGIDCQSHQDS